MVNRRRLWQSRAAGPSFPLAGKNPAEAEAEQEWTPPEEGWGDCARILMETTDRHWWESPARPP